MIFFMGLFHILITERKWQEKTKQKIHKIHPFFFHFNFPGFLCRRQILHRWNFRSLSGQRDVGCRPLQSDHVLLSGTVPEEEPQVPELPPPRPRWVESGVGGETRRREKLPGCGPDGNAEGSVQEGWVSVQVLSRVGRWGLLQEMLKKRKQQQQQIDCFWVDLLNNFSIIRDKNTVYVINGWEFKLS